MTARHHPLPSLSDVDLRLLRVFHAVVQNNGFAAAQEELGISPSNISIQISQLETRLGVRLCERGRKGFRLTEQGRLVFEASSNLFRAVESFRGLVGSVRGQLVGEIHFGFVDAVVTNRPQNLELALAEFADLAPEVVLNLDISSPQELLQGVAEDRYHVVLTPVLGGSNPSCELHPVFGEKQSLYVGHRHPLFARADADIDVEEVIDAPFVGRTYMRDWEAPVGRRFSEQAVTAHMECSALLILSGRYIGYLPTHYAQSWVDAGEMRPLLDERFSYSDQFDVVHRRDERNQAVLLFIECLLRQLGK